MKINKTYVILGIVALLLFGFISAISSILLPFVLAFVLAYFLNPLVVKLERHKWSRTLSTAFVVTGFCIFVVSILLILIPVLQTQVAAFMVKVPSIVAVLWAKIKIILSYAGGKFSPEQMYQLSDAVSGSVFSVLNSVGAGLMSVVSGGIVVFNVLALIVITPVVLFYVLNDWEVVSKRIKGLVPHQYAKGAMNIWSEINRTLSGFIRGQISVCLCLAVYYAVGLSLVGLELGALVGMIAGILSFIPYFGFLTGVLLSILLAVTQDATMSMWIGLAIIFSIGQILESYILTPKLVGDNVGLHPVWVIFALLAGGVLFGFLGILVAVPVAAVIGVLVRYGVRCYKETAFYKGK